MKIAKKDAAVLGRSHVERMLQKALGLTELVADDEGDYPVEGTQGVYYVSVAPHGLLCKVWAVAAWAVPDRAPVLREVNDHNRSAGFVRTARHPDGVVVVEARMPVPMVDEAWLTAVCCEVEETAASLGPMLAAVHGGCTTWHASAEGTCV